MISVVEALEKVLSLGARLSSEEVPLRAAAGRVLAEDLRAKRTQPPFSASAMDGYAVQDGDWATGTTLRVIGEAAAGHAFDGAVRPGEAVRIFTGAPLPEGADRVVIQEDVTRTDDLITLGETLDTGRHVRPAGGDFHEGDLFAAPRKLGPADIALLASMNHAVIPVVRKPVVAIMATGDELVAPGEAPNPDQIIASNSYGIAAQLEAAGAETRLLPIARDTRAALRDVFAMAKGADLIVTIGGASVGDHDLVAEVAADLNMDQSFYKIAMRPGKPLMAGNMDGTPMIGLPGNPVSSMVCSTLFIVPLITKMLGLPAGAPKTAQATLANDLTANGPREHYMRAQLEPDGTVRVHDAQDSALMSVLAASNALVVRPIRDPARAKGESVSIITL
jgi:molybdopterin molybdotransferase